MRLLHHGSARSLRPAFLTVLSVVPFTGLLALGAASTQDPPTPRPQDPPTPRPQDTPTPRPQDTPASRQQTQARAETGEKLDLLDQSHATFRKSVLGEFERAAPLKNVRIDSKSLIITSCNDGAMVAGLAVSPQMDLGPERSDIVKQERTPTSERTDPNVRDGSREILGMIAISGNFLGVRSGPVDASTGRPIPGATTPGMPVDTTLDQGFYLVRRDPSGNLQLINKDERIVVSVPFHHGRSADFEPMDKDLNKPGNKDTGKPGDTGKPVDTPGRGDAQGRADAAPGRDQTGTASQLGNIAEWPKIYMAILHAVEPRFAR